MVKDAKKYASLSLVHPQPLITWLMKDEEVPVKKIGVWLKTAAAERDVEELKVEYKQTKIKAVVRLYRNEDPAMEVLRQFEERSQEKGRRSMVKDAKKYASEFGLKLSLVHPQPLITCLMKDEEAPVKKIGVRLKTAAAERDVDELKVEGWLGSLLSERFWRIKRLERNAFLG